MTKSQVLMLFGDTVVNILDVFAPALVCESVLLVRVAEVKYDGLNCQSAGNVEDNLPNTNNYVIGLEASNLITPSPSMRKGFAARSRRWC